MLVAVALAYVPIRSLPDLAELPQATLALAYTPVSLPARTAGFTPAGAWEMSVPDARFTGLSALAIRGERLLAVTDRGAVLLFDRPGHGSSRLRIADLRDGPGPWGEKWSRDAESLALDPSGRGWWVGFEQRHSLYLYDPAFLGSLAKVDLGQHGWAPNRGAEGLVAGDDGLLVLAENGREALRISSKGSEQLGVAVKADVADAARAPDGSVWLLLRTMGVTGIRQSVAQLLSHASGYRLGPLVPVPKGRWDNLEGMAIEEKGTGGWRFWLVSDDGHRLMARTILIALDFDPAGHKKSPAPGAGPSPRSSSRMPY